ncbi:hypothetical protein GCM10010507_62380 [Streptomyces cinnamoneus]|uniref:Uncharacterized protein n=1 Tax=Streptomyces cinnamoneus TaxID=53446 RepID=A0A918U079_STRCJ|nr:hypothetical protein GCM10010507_62380 [Streptomyces cinnamoneus]
MTKLNFRWFDWARARLSSAKPISTDRRCAAAPVVRPPANLPRPAFTVRVSAHGIDFIPCSEDGR